MPTILHKHVCLAWLIFLLIRSEAALIQLTDDNVETFLLGKKATFIMFYGSDDCEACIEFAPTWRRMADDWEGHPYGQIAQVDCEGEGTEAICSYFRIEEIPTLVVGGSMEWDFYEGPTDYESLSDFAKRSISKPICTARVPENCMEEDLAILNQLQSKSTEELMEIEEKARQQMFDLQDEFEKHEKDLKQQQQVLMDEMNALMNEAAGEFDLKFVLQVMERRIKENPLEA